jgi:hypothetical protein
MAVTRAPRPPLAFLALGKDPSTGVGMACDERGSAAGVGWNWYPPIRTERSNPEEADQADGCPATSLAAIRILAKPSSNRGMEVRGIEPLSEKPWSKLSTRLAVLLI